MGSTDANSNSSRRSARRRPAYMLLFIDYLRRHNSAQPKFAPKRTGTSASSTPATNQRAGSTTRVQHRPRSQQRGSTASDRLPPPKRAVNSVTDSVALIGPETVRRSQRSSKASTSSSTTATRSTENKGSTTRGGSNLSTTARRTSQIFNQKSPGPSDEQSVTSISPVALLAQYFRLPALPDFFTRRQAPPETASAPAAQVENLPGPPATSTDSPAVVTQTQTQALTQEHQQQPAHQVVQSPPSPPDAKTVEPIVTINSNPESPDNAPHGGRPQEQQPQQTATPEAPRPAELPAAPVTQPALISTKKSEAAAGAAPAGSAAQQSASQSNSQQMATTATGQQLRLPRMKGFRGVSLTSAAKESNAPSLTQTPAAAVGASNTNQPHQTLQPPLITSEQQQQLARVGIGTAKVQAPTVGARSGGATAQLVPLTAEQQKKISIARAVAEQTPNATELLGSGFAVRMPGEQSDGNRNNDNNKNKAPTTNNKTGPLEAIPSDYEHIFHCTSNVVDESIPQQQAQQQGPQTQTPSTQQAHPRGHTPSPGPKRDKVKTPANKPTNQPKAGKDQQRRKQQNKKGKPTDKKAKVKKQK